MTRRAPRQGCTFEQFVNIKGIHFHKYLAKVMTYPNFRYRLAVLVDYNGQLVEIVGPDERANIGGSS